MVGYVVKWSFSHSLRELIANWKITQGNFYYQANLASDTLKKTGFPSLKLRGGLLPKGQMQEWETRLTPEALIFYYTKQNPITAHLQTPSSTIII